MTFGAQMSFDGAVALITGGGRGLGKAYASLLAARSAKVVVNDLEFEDASTQLSVAEQTAREIREAGGIAIGVSSDITREAGAKAAVAAAMDHFGRLDAIINNAGTVCTKDFANTHLDDLDEMLTVHVRGAFLVTKAAWKIMAAQRYGRVVMTTSSAGLYGQAGLAAYGAAKAALIGMTRALAVEGEQVGIRTNAVSPLGHTRLNADLPDEKRRAFFQRRARVEQVAPLVALLAHRDCPVNGEIIDAGAGRFARVMIGAGRGYIDVDATIETVRDNFAEVLADRDYHAPTSADDTVAHSVRLIKKGGDAL